MGRWAEVHCNCSAECGHPNGVLVELWPGDIFHLGDLIGSIFRDESGTFEVFPMVGNWRLYEDELLLIPPDRAALWLLEIEEILRTLQGSGHLPWKKMEKLIRELFRSELGFQLGLERRLDEVAAAVPFARIVSFRETLQRTERPDLKASFVKMAETLSNAARLCDASIETGNPIRLLW